MMMSSRYATISHGDVCQYQQDRREREFLRRELDCALTMAGTLQSPRKSPSHASSPCFNDICCTELSFQSSR